MSRPGDVKKVIIDLNRYLQTLESKLVHQGLDPSSEILADIEDIQADIRDWQSELETLDLVEHLPRRQSPMSERSIYAVLEDTAAAVEAERYRLAVLLQSDLITPLRLLLSQADVFERTLRPNPAVQGPISMLVALARQTLQQVHDLVNHLHPTTLETMGLGPALEALANQAIRAHGLQISLALEPPSDRLPQPVELALFRAAQDIMEHAIHQARASHITVRLTYRDELLVLSLSNNGTPVTDTPLQRITHQRLEQLGGILKTGIGLHGDFEVTITFTIKAQPQLTAREVEVLKLLAEGLSNKEIARRLSITPRTVNFHLDNIYSKLGVNSRTEAVIYALRYGWFNQPPPIPG